MPWSLGRDPGSTKAAFTCGTQISESDIPQCKVDGKILVFPSRPLLCPEKRGLVTKKQGPGCWEDGGFNL